LAKIPKISLRNLFSRKDEFYSACHEFETQNKQVEIKLESEKTSKSVFGTASYDLTENSKTTVFV